MIAWLAEWQRGWLWILWKPGPLASKPSEIWKEHANIVSENTRGHGVELLYDLNKLVYEHCDKIKTSEKNRWQNPPDHSCHDHGRKVPCGRSCWQTYNPGSTCLRNSHTSGTATRASVSIVMIHHEELNSDQKCISTNKSKHLMIKCSLGASLYSFLSQSLCLFTLYIVLKHGK